MLDVFATLRGGILIAGDDGRAIHATLRALLAQSDLIVTTGGALTSLGAPFVLRGVRMKPGKPAASRAHSQASSGFGGQCSEARCPTLVTSYGLSKRS
ncbi:hypothetical protein [Paraburkholderia sp. RAU2J]|uniref:hypothetical protein n=1 Tax=Paraburkholderia sp. RAU2J TaxID=1938810 RepID=UPI001F548239|nr:hypothetical protein [Paraburkholderia sp. RAU2J]